MKFADPLPIDAVLADIGATLARTCNAVLVAPPGAGKTTRVPLALLDSAWRGNGRIIVLEPRRLAARGAAARMAASLAENVGQTVGIRARLDTRVSSATRIEVVTEGVFARMILDDPTLDGVAAVLFDEFHERSLDADLGLALALDAQALRDDLRILVMSATLDGARVAALLGQEPAPVLASEGRSFPVRTEYLGRDTNERIERQMVAAIVQATRRETGSILAFLPGQGEIKRVAEQLGEQIKDPAIIIAPLYGAMDQRAQDAAVKPASQGTRKIVLATSIAETSLTIEGVRVVVDCGLARVPRYEPGIGLTRLETVRVSQASADQRRGRAGRTEPGVCYRLWDEPQTLSLAPFGRPEILDADLSGLMLDLADWGATDPAQLRWLDPPPDAAVREAKTLLINLGALGADGRITPLGKALRTLPLPPRLGAMVLNAATSGDEGDAALLAALMSERGLGGNQVDLAHRLDGLRRGGGRSDEMRRLAAGWAKSARASAPKTARHPSRSLGALVALAYPDRIAKARGALGQFLLANGRAAAVEVTDALARAPFLAVAELTGSAATARIVSAAAVETAEFETDFGARIVTADELTYDVAARALRARRVRRLESITLASSPLAIKATEDAAIALARGVAQHHFAQLPFSKDAQQLRDRVAFLRASDGGDRWPDLSDVALKQSAEHWLAAFLTGRTALSEITADVLSEALRAILPWELTSALEQEAPTHFTAPTGNRHPIDYEAHGAPLLSIRVQELFGLKQHPSIAGGRLQLTLELLSPAHRPIQITRDLTGFWAGSWSAVKSEMRGRYPRHPWPDDPADASPTSRAKPRGT